MNLESQVASLDLSKRLHELGVRAPALFYWYSQNEKDWELHVSKNGQRYSEYNIYQWNYNAYTVAELGMMLPAGISFDKTNGFPYANVLLWHAWADTLFYTMDGYPEKRKLSESKLSEADCRAKALIYCIEQKLVMVQDINNE